MTLSKAVKMALNDSIQAIQEETQYKETANTIAEVKYFESQVQSLLKRYRGGANAEINEILDVYIAANQGNQYQEVIEALASEIRKVNV